jgi:transcriptional regulator with XRE-family HTH domain
MSAIGERIRLFRNDALMTQDDLAAAAGVSTDLIRKLEQGQRHTASIASLHRIARALDVEVGDLLGRGHPPTTNDRHALILDIRDALTPVDDLAAGPLAGTDPPGVPMISRSVTYGWGAYWGGRYSALGAMLPDLLVQSRALVRACPAADRPKALDLAAQVQQLAAGTLLRLGSADLAHVAARESLRLAADAEDPLRDAAMRSTFTYVLMRQGRFADAERVAAAAAQEMQPAGNATAAQLSVYGGLLLRGATAAARGGRAASASEMLAEATDVARRTRADRTDYEVVFGPSNVVMQSADVAVVTEDYAAAAGVARRMPRGSVLPLAARSRHLADVAHAQLRLGRDRAAESALLTMERSAPAWTAHHQLPRLLVGELLTRGRPSSRLRDLAQRLHVTPGTAHIANQDE